MARSRVRPAICSFVRIDQTCFGRRGGLAPISLPLFQGSRRDAGGGASDDIAQSTVAKYMSQRHGPRSPGWKAFLRNHTAHIAGIDLFVVPTIGFKLLYGLVI